MKVEISKGALYKAAEILRDFPRNILIVADKNTLLASQGLLEVLKDGGFRYTVHCYEDCKEADIIQVKEVEMLLDSHDGVLAVGSGSIGDICRLASFYAKKEFAIFATASSMDGYSSNSAPITFNNFKESIQCHAPSVIIADTDILAKAPVALKSAGFGDVVAKYVALADWKIAALVAQEKYCPNVAKLVSDVLEKSMALAEKVTDEDSEAAGAIMEALVLSGICMTLIGNTRPASAAEHLLSHYWEMKKMERKEPITFHGEKVGVGTLLIIQLYHDLVDGKLGEIVFGEDEIDWEGIYRAYGVNLYEDIKRLNSPTITEKTSPEILQSYWPEICRIIKEELPSYEVVFQLMEKAGAMTSIEEIGVDRQLALDSLEFHPYMRYRVNLTRLFPMLGIKPDYSYLL